MISTGAPLLTIDVGERTFERTDITDLLHSYVGGRGVGTALAHERIPFDGDPLGPENRLIFAIGPLQVARTSFTGRTSLSGLSPLTNGLLSTNAGGFLSRNIADTGHCAIEITGRSEDLLAVHVTDAGVEFESVPELAGATVSAVSEHVSRTRGIESDALATVGPAGECGVRFASVMTFDSRAFGRGGLGAALGAKNVKVVSFRGDSRPTVSFDEETASGIHRTAATTDDLMKRQGTTAGTATVNDNFSLPTAYFERSSFEGIDEIDGFAVESKKYKRGTCSNCAFACKLPTRDEETGLETEGPEFETLFAFGSNCLVDDIVAIMKANDRCDDFGLDTISCGDTIAAYLASIDELGNVDLVHELVEQIAYRDGIGDVLAEGIDRIHEDLGVVNWTVKGLEFPAHDGRVLHGQGLSYAVANRGADHMYSTFLVHEYNGDVDPEGLVGKAELLVYEENTRAVEDCAILCRFSGQHTTEAQVARLLDAEPNELQDLGRRVVELERHFNNQRGYDRSADRVPYDLPDFDRALSAYYDERGWTNDGEVPTPPAVPL